MRLAYWFPAAVLTNTHELGALKPQQLPLPGLGAAPGQALPERSLQHPGPRRCSAPLPCPVLPLLETLVSGCRVPGTPRTTPPLALNSSGTQAPGGRVFGGPAGPTAAGQQIPQSPFLGLWGSGPSRAPAPTPGPASASPQAAARPPGLLKSCCVSHPPPASHPPLDRPPPPGGCAVWGGSPPLRLAVGPQRHPLWTQPRGPRLGAWRADGGCRGGGACCRQRGWGAG